MKRDYYITPKAGPVMRMLWKAAGGDRYILERATYSDQVKYACLGGIILATGGLAAIAGGYAFYTIFEPKGPALDSIAHATGIKDKLNYIHTSTVIFSIIFGLIWGLIIFNIDRFIVTSTGKGDGTEAITWDEFKSAIPRIIMGTIIAITISKPIEIRMFKTEIDIKLDEKQLDQQTAYIERIGKIEGPEIKRLNDEIKRVEDNLNFLVQNEGLARKDLRECLMKLGGDCPKNTQLYAEAKKAREDFELVMKPKLEKLENEKADKQGGKSKIEADAKITAAGLDGLLERIKICHEVAGGWITFFITMLFLAIELTPIFFKLMLTKTPYDYLTENRDDLIKAENGIEVRYDYYKDKDGLERHLVINHTAEKMIYEKQLLSTAEKVLNRYAIQKYIEIEKKKIDENPESYIKHNKESDENKLF